MWNIKFSKSVEEFLLIDEESHVKLREPLKINLETIETNLNELEEWTKQHSSLPEESQDRNFLFNIHHMNKFQMDKTKAKIEGYFIMFSEYSAFFKTLKNHKLSNYNLGTIILLNKTKLQDERIVIWKFVANKETPDADYNVTDFLLAAFQEYLVFSQFNGLMPIRYLLDFEGLTFGKFKTLDIGTLIKIKTIQSNGLKNRVSGYEIINAPYFLDGILAIMRLVLSSKLMKRVKRHDSLESLHEKIPKEYLPKEYGGSNVGIDDMKKKFQQMRLENEQFFDKIMSFVPKSTEENSIFGTEGTFKTLKVD